MASIRLGLGTVGRHAGRIRPPAVRFKLRPLAVALKPTGKAAWPGRLRAIPAVWLYFKADCPSGQCCPVGQCSLAAAPQPGPAGSVRPVTIHFPPAAAVR